MPFLSFKNNAIIIDTCMIFWFVDSQYQMDQSNKLKFMFYITFVYNRKDESRPGYISWKSMNFENLKAKMTH